MHRIGVRAARLEAAQGGAVEHAVLLQAIHGLSREVLGSAGAVGDGPAGHAWRGEPGDDDGVGPRLHQVWGAQEHAAWRWLDTRDARMGIGRVSDRESDA